MQKMGKNRKIGDEGKLKYPVHSAYSGKKKRKKGTAAVMILLAAAQLWGCSGSGGAGKTPTEAASDGDGQGAPQGNGSGGVSAEGQVDQGIVGENTSGPGKTAEYDSADLNPSWNEADSTVITCEDAGTKISGEGAVEEDGVILISKAGTYVLRGTYKGQVAVDAGKEDVVRLVMDGFHVSSEDTAPVYGIQSGKIVLILADGAENSVTDGDAYIFETADEDEPDAAIFSKDDLTINGQGNLTVNGNYSNGIRSKNDLKVVSGSLEIKAEKDGMKGKDSLCIKNGQINVVSGQDGLKSSNDSDAQKGYVVIEGGKMVIQAGDDGIHAETWLTIQAGEIDVQESNEGMEGLKVDINGGNIKVKSTDDGINAAGGGNGTVRDGGVAREGNMVGGDGGVAPEGSMARGVGGVVPDGNMAGGDDGGGQEGSEASGTSTTRTDENGAGRGSRDGGGDRGGRMKPQADEEAYIRIAGGTIQIDAMADGIDSNGNLYVEGGATFISGPVSGGDGALDYDGQAVINGGVLAAAGSSGMMEALSEESGQNMLMVYYNDQQEAETAVTLRDEAGKSIVEFTPAKEYGCILISTPQLEKGKAYQLTTGSNTQEIMVDGVVTQAGERPSGRGIGHGNGTGQDGMPGRQGKAGGEMGGPRDKDGEGTTGQRGKDGEKRAHSGNGNGKGKGRAEPDETLLQDADGQDANGQDADGQDTDD